MTPSIRTCIAALAFAALLAPPAHAQVPTEITSPGGRPGGDFGDSASGVPDFTGDGVDDFVIGATVEETGGTSAGGRVYLFNGFTGAAIRYVTSNHAARPAGFFGASVSGIPDVTGDDTGDILIGAPGEDVEAFGTAGRAYLYNGGNNVFADYEFVSPNPEDFGRFGTSVSGIPDVPTRYVLIGAPEEDTGGRADAGRAYLFDAATGLLSRTITSPTADAGGRFGESVAGVPDATGDGVGDYLIGAPDEDLGNPAGSGRAYLFDGVTGALLRTLVSPTGDGGRFGEHVSGVPDVDGDGRGDLLVGDLFGDGGALDAGRAFLFSGATGALLHSLTSPYAEVDGAFGATVSGIPDMDGDGRGDLLIGAIHEQYGAANARVGRAYLFSGATGALLRTLESPEQSGPVGFGTAVASIADVNNWGALLVGAPDVGEGRAYRYVGGPRTVALRAPEGWRLLASPVLASLSELLLPIWTQGAGGADVSDGDPSVFHYAEPVSGPRDRGFTALPTLHTAAATGRGYAVFVFEDDDLSTPGTQGGFNKHLIPSGLSATGSPITFPVTFTPSGSVQEDGWSLLGNPYDASMDWDAPGWTKANVDNVIYVWDAPASVYRTWNGTTGSLGDGLVADFQGFWAKANGPGPVLVAPAAARTTEPPPVEPLGPSLGLELVGVADGAPVQDAAFVAFIDGAADGLDPYDAYELTPLATTYATLHARSAAGPLLDVEARAPIAGAASFALDAAALAGGQPAAGTFTLAWPDLSTVPAGWRLTLHDTRTGQQVDLRTSPGYVFTLDAGRAPRDVLAPSVLTPPAPLPLAFRDGGDGFTPTARFVLVVEPAAVAGEAGPEATAFGLAAPRPNPVRGAAVLAYTLDAAGPARLVLYDALGREVAVLADGPLEAGRHEAALAAGRLSPGVYLARLEAGGRASVRTVTVAR